MTDNCCEVCFNGVNVVNSATLLLCKWRNNGRVKIDTINHGTSLLRAQRMLNYSVILPFHLLCITPDPALPLIVGFLP